MDLQGYSAKDIGNLGEKVTAEYLCRQNFRIHSMNVRAKFGELDIVAVRKNCLHIVEVKSLKCLEFTSSERERYDPGENLHQYKIRKIARTAAWYIGKIGWEGEWQVDGALVWLRVRDGMARVRYYPQIL